RPQAGAADPDPVRHPACALFGRGTRGDLGDLPDASALDLDVERLRAGGRDLRRLRAVHCDLADPGHRLTVGADLSLSVAVGGDLAAGDLEPEGNRRGKVGLDHDETKLGTAPFSLAPLFAGRGLGVRGCFRKGRRETDLWRVPLTRICALRKFDLSPQAGRGEVRTCCSDST